MMAAKTPPAAETPASRMVPDSDEFTKTLGQVTWLMGLSEAHKDLPISAIEARIQAPLMMRQVRVITRGKQPVAAVTWATVSETIEHAMAHPDFSMDLGHWRCGDRLVIVDVISPFVPREKIETLFWDLAKGKLKAAPSADIDADANARSEDENK